MHGGLNMSAFLQRCICKKMGQQNNKITKPKSSSKQRTHYLSLNSRANLLPFWKDSPTKPPLAWGRLCFPWFAGRTIATGSQAAGKKLPNSHRNVSTQISVAFFCSQAAAIFSMISIASFSWSRCFSMLQTPPKKKTQKTIKPYCK